MTPALNVVAWALVFAGFLPIVTAVVLTYGVRLMPDSPSLRDRWHVSIGMALVGLVMSLLALDALEIVDIGGESFWLAFGLAALAADVVSGKWLLEYLRGRFR